MLADSVASPSRLNDRVTQLLRRVEYRRAEGAEEKEAIFRLRYDAYLRGGEIAPSLSRRFTDPVDDEENTWNFGVYIDDMLAGSIRLSVTVPGCKTLPSVGVFPDVLSPEIEAGTTIIDPTRFVADRASSKRHPELPYIILRLPWIAMEYFKADLMLAAVRPEHQAFYKRLFGCRAICPPRPYPGLHSQISLMTCDYAVVQDQVHRRHPYFRSNFLERRTLFEREYDGGEYLHAEAGADLARCLQPG
jgi:N-acyl amino acid synthase FeeM